jgi:hypothetical protein
VREDIPLAVPQLTAEQLAPGQPGPAGHQEEISEATVKTHLLHAFGKLGVSGRTAAVTTAIERGLLPRPGENQ